MTLSFSTLRHANTLRLPLFKNSHGEPAHSQPDGSDWSLGEWMNAILGELGEAANIIKKVKRGDLSLFEAKVELGREFADIVIYADLTSLRLDLAWNYYPDFGTMRIRNIDYFIDAENDNVSLGEWMNRAAGQFGYLARVIDEGVYLKAPIAYYMTNMLTCIDCVANKAGLDLGHEVRSKFNAVSLRIGAAVFITANDTVTMDEEEIARLGGC